MHSALGARWLPRCWPRSRSRSVADSVVPTAGLRRVRITSNGWAAVAGAGLMFALAVQTQSVWMQVVGSALLGLLGISALSVVRRRHDVTVRMQAPTEVFVGVPFDIQVVVGNTGQRPTPPLRIRYDVNIDPPPVAPAVVYVDPVAAGETAVLSVTRVPLRRGAARSSRLVVDLIGSFGFFTSSYPVAGTPALFAAPLVSRPIDVTQVLSTEAGGSGPMGAGLDVRGVRRMATGRCGASRALAFDGANWSTLGPRVRRAHCRHVRRTDCRDDSRPAVRGRAGARGVNHVAGDGRRRHGVRLHAPMTRSRTVST